MSVRLRAGTLRVNAASRVSSAARIVRRDENYGAMCLYTPDEALVAMEQAARCIAGTAMPAYTSEN